MGEVLRYWYLNFCCGLIKITQLLMDLLVSVCVPYEIIIVKLVRVQTMETPIVEIVFMSRSIRDDLYLSVVEE